MKSSPCIIIVLYYVQPVYGEILLLNDYMTSLLNIINSLKVAPIFLVKVFKISIQATSNTGLKNSSKRVRVN